MGNSVTDHISPCSNWMTSSESKTQWCLSRKFQSFPSLTFKCLVWVFNPPFMISWPWYAQSNYYVAFPWLVQDFFVTKVCSRSALCFSTVTVNSLHGNVYFPMPSQSSTCSLSSPAHGIRRPNLSGTPVLIRMMSAWPPRAITDDQWDARWRKSCYFLAGSSQCWWAAPAVPACTSLPGFVTGVPGYVPPLSPPPRVGRHEAGRWGGETIPESGF